MPQFESHFFSSLIFWEVLSFAILFFVLYKFAFPGILGALEDREKKIKDSLDQAERHRSEAERKLKEYEAKLNTAAKEAEGILVAAKERAQRLMEENEQRLTTEAERIKGDATREIDHERRKAIQDIRAQTTDLALMVAEKIVQRSLNDADHRKFADEALEAARSVSFQIHTDEAESHLAETGADVRAQVRLIQPRKLLC
jgi:F-type H+-transporting ATPase subunit b